MDAEVKVKKMCGFAVISAEKKSEISRKGNQRLRELGIIHKWDTQSAAAAGRVGGKVTQDQRREVAEVRKVLADIEREQQNKE